MNAPAPEPKPKRSRRMVVWMIAVPIVILLLALAGANWKFFHLAYAKHLIASDDVAKQKRGGKMVLRTHLRKGMSLEEVRAILEPAILIESYFVYASGFPELRGFNVRLEGDLLSVLPDLGFDENDRLLWVRIYYEDAIDDLDGN